MFRFILVCNRPLERVHFGFHIRGLDDSLLFAGHSQEDRGTPPNLDRGTYLINWSVTLPLKPGLYRVEVAAHEEMAPGRGDTWHPAQQLEVLESRFSSLPDAWRGLVNEPVAFSMSPAQTYASNRKSS